MKRFAMVCLILAMFGSGVARADDEKGEKKREKALKKFDTNGDGKLSKSEREAMEQAREERHKKLREKLLEKFDKNHDGKLSKEERHEAKEWLKKHRHHHHKKNKTAAGAPGTTAPAPGTSTDKK